MTRSTPTRRRPDNKNLRIVFGIIAFCLFAFGLFCSGLTGLMLFSNGPGIFIMATMLATFTAVPYGLLLVWLDHNEREPIPLLIAGFLWGALIATAFSGIVNTLVGEIAMAVTGSPSASDFMSASISAPFIEELTKGMALVVLVGMFYKEFDNVLDGVIYGAIVGLGFAWFENIMYYCDAASMGGIEGMIKNFWARGVVSASGGSHAAYSGLVGLGFGLTRMLRKGFARWMLIPLFLGLAMFAHFAWNTFVEHFIFIFDQPTDASVYFVSLPIAVLVLQLPFSGLLSLVVIFSWRHEYKIIRQHLADEPAEIITDAERNTLVPAWRRSVADLKRFFTKGPGLWLRHRRRIRHQVDLAFVKWHLANDAGVDWEADDDLDVYELREKIRVLRGSLS